MKLRIAFMLLAALLFVTERQTAKAEEHPKEHPTSAPTATSAEPTPATPSATITPAAATPDAAASAQPTSTPAAEHPKEHPREHPKTHKHSHGKTDIKKEFSKAVEDYVNNEKKAKGSLVIHDDQLNKDWNLELMRIHKKNIAKLGENSYFACADFKQGQGKTKTLVDLDFYATQTEAGWKVNQVLIHKVDQKPRFTYNASNQRIPVGSQN